MKKIFTLIIVISLSIGAYSQGKVVTHPTTPVHLTKKDFLKKVFDYEKNPKTWTFIGSRPAIIDFYATWCGPCKALAPTLDDIAKSYAGKVDVYKIDVDKEPELAAAFGVQSVPTLLFIPMTGQPHLAKGAIPRESFGKVIYEVLLKKD